MHRSIYVIQKSVTNVNSLLCCRSHGVPAICFLRSSTSYIVVSIERIESTQNGPPCAEVLGSVIQETTDISAILRGISGPMLDSQCRSYHWNLKESNELKEMANGSKVLVPC